MTMRHQSSTMSRFAFSLAFIAGLVCGLVGGLIAAASAIDAAKSPDSAAATAVFLCTMLIGSPSEMLWILAGIVVRRAGGTACRNRSCITLLCAELRDQPVDELRDEVR